MEFIEGHKLLFSFFWRHVRTLRSLPPAIVNPDVLDGMIATRKPFTVDVSDSPRTSYQRELNDIKTKMRELHSASSASSSSSSSSYSPDALVNAFVDPAHTSFQTKMVLFFALRIILVGCAFLTLPLSVTLAVGALQFVVLPYSLFVSFAELAVLFPAIFMGHYAVHIPLFYLHTKVLSPFLSSLINSSSLPVTVLARLLTFSIKIDTNFIILFFLIDQLLCIMCTQRTSLGPSNTQYTPKRYLHSVVFGFFNCKTYFLILLLYLRAHGLEIALLPWAVDAVTQASTTVTKWTARHSMHWAAIFYHQHCLAHIPMVYQDAHKFHHFLHDTTAFDAHIYGSGAPEEYFCLFVAELLPAVVFGFTPPSLSSCILRTSYANKESHSRKASDTDGCNFHADHHLYHTKNYGGFYPPLDMYMRTAVSCETSACPGYMIEKNQEVGVGNGEMGGEERGRVESGKGNEEEETGIGGKQKEGVEKYVQFVFTPVSEIGKKIE